MDFALSAEQSALEQRVRKFAEREIAPHVTRLEEDLAFRKTLFKKMAQEGLFLLSVPKERGGTQVDSIAYSLVMKAIAISSFGGPEVLQMIERPNPVAGPGEVLIAVEAYGINRPDVLQRKGAYPAPPGASDLIGLELDGRIKAGDALELAAAGLKIGYAVRALVAAGCYAQQCSAQIVQCMPERAGG